LRQVLPLLCLSVLLGGCGGDPSRDGASPPVELPEGDPGTAAPAAPEPTAAGEHADAAPLAVVPVGAVLDPETLAGVAGGRWTASAAGPQATGPCGALPTRAAARTVLLREQGGRVLVQTVLSYAHEEGLDAVAQLAGSFAACGYRPVDAPPLGEAAAQAEDGSGDRALVVAAEGAVVVLTGKGGLADDTPTWEAVADVALGSACPAAPSGCH
jgi:hypothetical protein